MAMGKRVLYIEDNISNRTLVRRILEAEGYEVHDSDNAADGIRLAQQLSPDLILMDLSMPELDGLTATRALRQITGLNDVPIIALTAHVMQDDRRRALQVCDGYIPKPIDVDTFAAEVRSFFRSG
ncbi:MAG: response regulator [Anaerolineae bacterium]|nr:response regulator [Anaerolineae bacterium]